MNSPFEIELEGLEGAGSRSADPLDNDLKVVTPENIAFQYRLAGPFRRVMAYAIDLAIIFFVYGIILGIVLLIFTLAMALLGAATGLQAVTEAMAGIGSMFYLFGFFGVVWFYGAILESFFNGQTLGKWLFGMRVLQVDGRAINGGHAVLRNFLRFADVFPAIGFGQLFGTGWDSFNLIPSGAIALIVMASNRRFQRLGDLFSRTVVVVDSKVEMSGLVNLDDVRVRQLASHIPKDFVVSKELAQALASYVDRRPQLTLPRLMEIAKHLAAPMLNHFQFDPSVNHDLFLCALYYHSFNDAQQDEAYTPPGISPVMKPRETSNPYEITYVR